MTLEKQELDRIEAAKTAIGTAIAGKGVAVPSGTKLDGMAALIDGIEAGGEDVSAETAEYTSLLTDLETAIDALPEAGGGGGGGNVETCTVTVNNVNMGMASFAYNSGTGPVYETNVPSNNASTEIIIQKNSVLTIYGVCLMPVVNLSGDIELLGDGNYLGMIKMFTFAITGEGTITIMDD